MSIRVVVAALIIRSGRVLITQRHKNDSNGLLWEFPGGTVKPGEPVEHAIIRELREELGITVKPRMLVDIQAVPRKQIVLLFYSCRLLRGTPANLGCKQFCWVLFSRLGKVRFCPADRPVARRLILLCGNMKT